MASKAYSIKKAIQEILEDLVRAQVLGEVQIDDFKSGVLDRNFSKYPTAVVTAPSIESVADTNRENMRTYTFEILVVQKSEHVTENSPIEDLIETLLGAFDKDMLTGIESVVRMAGADGGVEPLSSPVEATQLRGQNHIVFSIIVKAKGTYQVD